MPYILPPQKDKTYTSQYNYLWVQKATATKPAAFVYEIWGGYEPDNLMTAAQAKKWKAFKFPDSRRISVRKTVAAYKKKGYVVVTDVDIVKLFKEYVPRSYAAALKSKKIQPKSKYSFMKDGTNWVESYAPMANIWDKKSVVSVYNEFLNSMTWEGGSSFQKFRSSWKGYKSPASYFWGWGRPLDFSGSHNVIPMGYGSDTVMLHNYKTGKVAVVTDSEGDDDEAGYYGMSPVAFEWKMNPQLVAAMNKPIMSGKGQQYVMKGTGRGVRKPAAKAKPKAKPKPKDKPIMSGKGQQYVMKGTGRGVRKTPAKKTTKYVLGKKDRPTDVKKRKSPPYSAKQFPKGARKKGNNGKMWTIVTDKRSVKRWKA